MHSGGSTLGRPIIVVPASTYPGNLSLLNAVQFLRDGKFIDQKDVKQTSEEKYENKKTFVRKIGNDNVTFEVYDSVYGFTKKEWRRVVCLFTCGELFQLKDWPPKDGDEDINISEQDRQMKLVNLFHRVKGFYFHYQDVLEPPIVKKWNVSRFIIQRNKRHQDINVHNQVCKELDAFLKKEKFKDAMF